MSLTADLKLLVDALNGPEKRHFKRWLHNSGGQSQYEQLFDLFAKSKEVDEAGLRKHFSTLSAPGLANLKNYLHGLILRALADYHRAGSVKIGLRGRLNEIEVMATKGFLDQALSAVKKVRKKALELEALSIVYLTWEQQENIYARSGLDKIKPSDWEKLYNEKKEVARKVGLVDQIRQLERRILILNSTKGALARSSELDADVDGIIEQLPIIGQMKDAPFDAMFRYHQVLATGARMKLHHDDEVEHFQAIVDLINAHPVIKKSYYYEYYPVALHNLINSCFLAQKLDLVPALLTELEDYSSEHLVLKARNFYYSFHNRMAYNKYNGHYELSLNQYKAKVDELEIHRQYLNVPSLFHIHFTMAEAHFWTGKFREAANLLRPMINDSTVIDNEDLSSFARILMILVHYEREDYEYMGHLIGVCERFLKKKHIMHQTEKELLAFLRKIHRQSKKPAKTEWSSLHSKLEKISENVYERNLNHTFDVLGYVGSKC